MKAIRFLDKWFEEIIMSIFMAYFAVAIILQVFFRTFGIPAPWTEETGRYAFIWMTMIGSAVAVKQGLHVRVDILENMLPKKIAPFLKWFCMTLFLVFFIILGVVGVGICLSLIELPQMTATLKISTVWVFVSLPIGMFLSAFRLVQNMIRAYIGYCAQKKEVK